MQAASQKRLLFLLKLGLGIAIVIWLVKTGRFDVGMYRELSSAGAMLALVMLLLAQSGSLLVILSRWWLLLRAQGIPISLADSVWLSCRGTFMGLFLPGTLGTDGLRIWYLQRYHRDQLLLGIASVTLDRVLGFFGLLLLAVGFGGLYAAVSGATLSPVIGLWLLLLALSLVLLAFLCGYGPQSVTRMLSRLPLLGPFMEALATYRSCHAALLGAIGLSVVGNALLIVAAAFGLTALGLDFSLLALAAVTPILIVVRFLPLTPLGLGVSDAAAVELYQLAGLAGGAENQMLMRAGWIVIVLLCGLSFFRSQRVISREYT